MIGKEGSEETMPDSERGAEYSTVVSVGSEIGVPKTNVHRLT